MIFKGSTYSAVVPPTNLFGLYQIPEPEPGQLLIIPINLVLFQWRLKFDMKLKTSLPVIWLETFDTKNPGWSVCYELTVTKLILVDPVDDEEEIRPRTDPPNVWQCDLKKRKNVNTHPIDRSSLYIGYGNRINFFIQIFFQCDHRLTSFCQLDLQEAGKLTLKFQAFALENILES
jgi:hypothetical protein